MSVISFKPEQYHINGAYGEILVQYAVSGTNYSLEYHNILSSTGENLGRLDADTQTRFYYLKDHLGSVRVTIDEDGVIVGYDDYFPFGMQMSGRNWNQSNDFDDQKFTGHFLEQEGNLGIYHAGARLYDPEVPRFYGVDGILQRMTPIELLRYDNAKHLSLSPYVYVRNNPILYFDPEGLTDWVAFRRGLFQTLSGGLTATAGFTLIATGSALWIPSGGITTPKVFGGSFLVGLGGSNVGMGIANMKLAIDTPEGLTADEYKSFIKVVSEAFGANETQQEALNFLVDIATSGGLLKTGKLIADDKIIQALINAGTLTDNIQDLLKAYEREYILGIKYHEGEEIEDE